jgi:hypothetical protein
MWKMIRGIIVYRSQAVNRLYGLINAAQPGMFYRPFSDAFR